MAGHYTVIIGYDDMGTDIIEDDVVIVKKVGETKSLLQRMKETVDIIMNKKN